MQFMNRHIAPEAKIENTCAKSAPRISLILAPGLHSCITQEKLCNNAGPAPKRAPKPQILRGYEIRDTKVTSQFKKMLLKNFLVIY
jgi:hypothetical protein